MYIYIYICIFHFIYIYIYFFFGTTAKAHNSPRSVLQKLSYGHRSGTKNSSQMPPHMDIIHMPINMDTLRMKLKEMVNHMGDAKETKVSRPGAKPETISSTLATLEVGGILDALPENGTN